MATQQQTGKPLKTRQMTILRKRNQREGSGGCAIFPIITLTGKWLQQSGFKSGQVIDITCETGRLVITPAHQQRFEGF